VLPTPLRSICADDIYKQVTDAAAAAVTAVAEDLLLVFFFV